MTLNVYNTSTYTITGKHVYVKPLSGVGQVVLTNFDHDRQWFNTLIPPSHESVAVIVDCCLYFTL